MITEKNLPITKRDDGSYVIMNNGLPYHVCKAVEDKNYSIKNIEDYIKDNKVKIEIDENKPIKTEQQVIDENKYYLRETDFHIIKSLELGTEIPKDILLKRAEARLKINEIELKIKNKE